MADHLLIEDGGLLSTVQDLGRFGYQRFGISASGAMDPVSMQIANALVGNSSETAVIEVTVRGPSFTVEAEACRIAFAGGDFALTVNGAAADSSSKRAPWMFPVCCGKSCSSVFPPAS